MSAIRSAAFIATVLLAACGDSATEPAPPPAPAPPAPVASVELTPATFVLAVGQSQAITAVTRDAAGKVLNGRTRSFESSAPAFATVSDAGVVTGVAPGEAEITVSSEGRSATATVTVQPAAVAAVQIAPGALTIDLGGTGELTVTLRDGQGNVLTGREITFTSANPQVATVTNDGLVAGLAGGSTFVTATSEGKSSDVLVVVHVPVAMVEITNAPDTLEAHDIHQLGVILRDAQGTVLQPRPTLWTSSNPQVAIVDATTGKVTGLDRGNVTITAEREGIEGMVSIEIVIKYRSITAGTMHACDIASGGIAWCWGLNGNEGRIGLAQTGDAVFRAEPHLVPGNHRFTQLVTYSRTTCGLTTEGKAYCWGTNNWGALGNGGNGAFSSVPVAVAGNHTFTQLTAGMDHACGTTQLLGATYCWGHNDWGQFGTGNTASANAPVAAAEGMVFLRVAAASSATCGIAVTGAAYCWGASGLGQLGDGGPISYGNTFKTTPVMVAGGLSFSAISAGSQFVCGITVAGQGYCWGGNNGRLGNGGTADASAPQLVSGGHNFRMLSAGSNHACAVTVNDEIYCWGSNGNGQLGVVAPSGSTVPIRAGGSVKAAEVAAAGIGTGSGAHTCAISRDRLTTWCWGRNDVGQLGNGQTTAAPVANTPPSIVVGQQPR